MNLNEYKGSKTVERMRDTIASKKHDLGKS